MNKVTGKQNIQQPKLQEALVLFNYILSLFGCRDFSSLSDDLKDPALEGVDSEGTSHIFYALKARLNSGFTIDEEHLYEYDRHIVQYTKDINEHRVDKITWKYYQYLALLFSEVYLDRFFSDKTALLLDLNRFLTENFNFRKGMWHEMPAFTENDLNKIAFWCATGSGKTLLMHINIKQFLYYAGKHRTKQLNHILILTPNEGLSLQHIAELKDSGFYAEPFNRHGQGGCFSGRQTVEVIDIYKLAETDGDKTVAVDSFEGNNLVLVDEGHRGSGGEVERGYRNKLTQEGFSFEYSATFGQAIAALTGENRKALLQEYGKATLFDYSYRHFYNDGYGKDYHIMNMASWDDEGLLNMYLSAYFLCLYEQTLAYEASPSVKNSFLISRPLGIFVGGSVNAVQKVRGRPMSDVTQILLFIQSFIDHPEEFTGYIKRLLNPDDGIKNSRGYSLFANCFTMIKDGLRQGEEEEFARHTYLKILKKLFHSDIPNARLHIDRLKGGEEEIGLRVGNADYFGVINVGDSSKLMSLCEDSGLMCEIKEFSAQSLFSNINEDNSSINLLIGSKKFNEGWSSWRVSVMGLMNVGRSEGSEIIQLFGRGVRLKGFRYSLKRSSRLNINYNPGQTPRGLRDVETLNIFGVRADYMEAFRKYLEAEGLPGNEDTYIPIKIPTVNLLGDTRLKVVHLKKDSDFNNTVIVHPLDMIDKICIVLDQTPRVDSISSEGAGVEKLMAMTTGILQDRHLSLLDWNKIYFSLEEMKNERNWWNMELNVKILKELMSRPIWYKLTILEADLEFHDFERDLSRWEEITIALLQKYLSSVYTRNKCKWESQFMEVAYIDDDDPNFFEDYTVEVRQEQKDWIDKLTNLHEQITSGSMKHDFSVYNSWIQAMYFDRHLYFPLFSLKDKDDIGNKLLCDRYTKEPLIKVSPIALNPGESSFVEKMRKYYEENKDGVLRGREVYLLRNESRKGIGFFETSNFYPDFILWVTVGEKQHVTFIDPKGIRNLRGFEDAKIQLFNTLKKEVEPSLNDIDIMLDSYIISNTQYKEVSFWGKKSDFTANHILFEEDSDYPAVIFDNILSKLSIV